MLISERMWMLLAVQPYALWAALWRLVLWLPSLVYFLVTPFMFGSPAIAVTWRSFLTWLLPGLGASF